MSNIRQIPVFIICRDRLSCLKSLLEWLERIDQKRIILLDNNSTYPPLLNFYKSTKHEVIRFRHNYGQTVLWRTKQFQEVITKNYYILSDPDVVPDKSCPLDAIEYLYQLLERYHTFDKAGFGLKIDDIPSHYQHREDVIRWERRFWVKEIEPNVFDAPIDTTFALYRPGVKYSFNSIRTGSPYIARHIPWYVNSRKLTDEELFYRKQIRKEFSHWTSYSRSRS